MIKKEFEALALRGNAEIGPLMYDLIERFYMSDNGYHERHGGLDETKQDFVRRVFGGKVNTPKTIARKIADESNRENRWALRGSKADKQYLDEYEAAIRGDCDTLLRYSL